MFLLIFRGEGVGREREGERISRLPPVHAWTRGRTCNLGVCPDQDWNCNLPVCEWRSNQLSHQAGQHLLFYKSLWRGPGQVSLLVKALSQCTRVLGLIHSQGTYRNQPMDAWISGTMNQCFSFSKINKFFKKSFWSKKGRKFPLLFYFKSIKIVPFSVQIGKKYNVVFLVCYRDFSN